MGLPVERLTIATNVNDILARTLATGAYELRDVTPTTSPSMDIQVSSNFERLMFEAYGRDPQPVRGAMAALAQSRRFTVCRACARRDARPVHRRPRARGRDRGGDPHHAARDRLSARSAYRGRGRGRREGNAAIPPSRWWCCRPPIRRSFPMRSRPPAGSARPCPIGLPGSTTRPERFTVLPADQAAVEHHILAHSRAAREGVPA